MNDDTRDFSSQLLTPGDRIASYAIHSRICRGQFGEVYDALDLLRGMRVSILRLFSDLVEERRRVDELLRYRQMLSQLDHTNIVRLLAVEDTEVGLITVSEPLIGSITLRQRLVGASTISADDTAKIGVQLCDALIYAHHNLLHGAIRADSVWILPNGQVKLADFGLALLLGVPIAMSGQEPNAETSEQAAIGSILLEALTGADQLAPSTDQQIGLGIGSGKARAVALNRDPTLRFSDLNAMKDALVRRWYEIPTKRSILAGRVPTVPTDLGTTARMTTGILAAAGVALASLVILFPRTARITAEDVPSQTGSLEQTDMLVVAADTKPAPTGKNEASSAENEPAHMPETHRGQAAEDQNDPDPIVQAQGGMIPEAVPEQESAPGDSSVGLGGPSARDAGTSRREYGPPETQRTARRASIDARSTALDGWRGLERSMRNGAPVTIMEKAELWRLLTEAEKYFAEERFEEARDAWFEANTLANDINQR